MAAAADAMVSRAVVATDLGSSSDLDCAAEFRDCWGVKVASGDGERAEV